MPLSEHEQRLLDEMERNLYRHDAGFAATVSGRSFRPSTRSIVWGALLAVFGVAVIVTGLVVHLALIGVAGFIIVLTGVVWATRTAPSAAKPGARASAKSRRGFMDRMNDRWDRRTG